MNLLKCGDVSFVQGWTQPYYDRRSGAKHAADPLTGVEYPAFEDMRTERYKNGRGQLEICRPSVDFIEKQFPALDAKIETPIAFAILAPQGWKGECAWYAFEHLQQHGWEPFAWKESTHCDKTFVQLFRRLLDRPEPSEAPKFGMCNYVINYSNHAVSTNGLPYLGCSSILTAWDKPHTASLDWRDLLPDMYGGVDPKKCLHLLRCARPMSVSAIEEVKREGYFIAARTSYNQYWVRGKRGLGSPEECEY